MRYLGIDWGLKRIGLAVSAGDIAAPKTTLRISSFQVAISKIVNIVKKEGIDVVVVGKPEGEMGEKVEKVTKRLKNQGLEVILTDETLSTKEARQVMITQGLGREARKEDNAVAAALILQRFLDERKASS